MTAVWRYTGGDTTELRKGNKSRRRYCCTAPASGRPVIRPKLELILTLLPEPGPVSRLAVAPHVLSKLLQDRGGGGHVVQRPCHLLPLRAGPLKPLNRWYAAVGLVLRHPQQNEGRRGHGPGLRA